MQKMVDRLNKTCKAYGMEINVKKTKVMIMNGTAKPKGMQRCITLNNVPLEQVTRFKYLGSWITENARSDEDIRARVGMAGKHTLYISFLLLSRKLPSRLPYYNRLLRYA